MEYVALIGSSSTLHYRGGSSTEYFKENNDNTTFEVKWILHLSINTHFEKLDDKIGIQFSRSRSSDVWGRIVDQSHTCPCLSLEWCFNLRCYRSGKKVSNPSHFSLLKVKMPIFNAKRGQLRKYCCNCFHLYELSPERSKCSSHMFNHVQPHWIILHNSHWLGRRDQCSVQRLALLPESERGSSTELQCRAQFRSPPYTYASKVFIHPPPLHGWKQWILHDFPSKDKSARFVKKAGIVVPPRIHSRPPAWNPPSEVTSSREEMPACLIEDLLLHIHVWISGEDSLIKHSKKSNSKHLLFWIWGPVWCLQGCTVMKKKKRKQAQHCILFCGAENESPCS